jgi:type I restriction enzyme S subunit
MKSEWNIYKISDIATIIGGGTPKTKIKEYWNGNIPWLTPKDLTGYTNMYISHGERFITTLGLKKSSAKLMPKGTVLLTSRAPIGYVAIAANKICTNQGFKSLIPKDNLCNSEFLYYWIKKNVDKLKQLGTGTTFAEISGSVLKSVDIELPPLPTQKKIAHILSTLDDKIELNRKINKTLEAMAQALFKSWFVDFEPVHAKMGCKNDEKLTEAANKLGISKEILDLFPNEFEGYSS